MQFHDIYYPSDPDCLIIITEDSIQIFLDNSIIFAAVQVAAAGSRHHAAEAEAEESWPAEHPGWRGEDPRRHERRRN